jgi:hypothetical protein
MDIYNKILNKNTGQQFYTGVVFTLNPLTVKFFDDDTAISVVHTSNLFGIVVGSKLIMAKIDNQFFAIGIVGNDSLCKCALLKDDTQSIPDSTSTKITFVSDDVKYDPLEMFNDANNRIIIPQNGLYEISANGRWENSGTGDRIIYIDVNGSNLASVVYSPNSRAGDSLSIKTTLETNDYVEISVWQNSTGALDFGGATYYRVGFSVEKIG